MKRNSVEIIGNVVQEPSKIDIAIFLRIAIWNFPKSKKDKNKDEAKKPFPSTYVDVSFFKERKEIVDEMNLSVGQPVYIKGHLSTKKEDVNGKNITVISIIGDSLEIVKTKKEKETAETNEE